MKKALLTAKSVGYSTGPSGTYLVSLFEKMGIADQVRAKAKLKAYGIAPPGQAIVEQALVPLMSSVRRAACPYCGSSNTERRSEFGSTACKAHYRCDACLEPFDYFKCH